MNKERRGKIRRIINETQEIKNRLQVIMDEEEDCFDNLSEGLQCTMRGEEMQDAIDTLDESIDKIDDVIECLLSI